MSRAMGSSCVFTCWGAASWHGGRVMLVFGARAAAGAGSCAGGGAPFGVVVVCGCMLVAVLAGGVAPVCGSGCGRWWVLSWREVCGVSRGGAGGVGCGVPCPRVGEGGAVRYGGVVLCGLRPVGGGGTVSRSGGVGCRPWFVLWRCGAAPRGLLIVLLACFCTWAVRGRCGVGPGVPWGGVCGTGVSQPGGCGRVVLGGVGQPLSGPSGAGYCVCGVRGSLGRGFLGVLWPRCGARGW